MESAAKVMKIIDRYILKGFAFSFLVVFLSMISLTIIIDMVVNLDEFLKARQHADATAVDMVWQIVSYYAHRSFEYFQWLSGAVTLIAAAFAIARLNKSNELIALKSSGVSVFRVFWPIIMCGAAIAAGNIINQQFILPHMVEELTGKRSGIRKDEITVPYVVDDHAALIYAPRYRPAEHVMLAEIRTEPETGRIVYRQPVRIIQRDAASGEILSFIEADAARYSIDRGGWELEAGVRFMAAKIGDAVPDGPLVGEPVDFYRTSVTPRFLERHSSADAYNYLSYRNLDRLLRYRAAINADVVAVTMHKHFARPVLNIVLLLLGLPLIVGREGKSYMASIMLCMALFVIVLASDYMATEFGMSGHVPPIVGAWLPVLIFTPVAIISLQRTHT